MSHPVPGHTYGENEYPDVGHAPTSRSRALDKKIKGPKKTKKSAAISKLNEVTGRLLSKMPDSRKGYKKP